MCNHTAPPANVTLPPADPRNDNRDRAVNGTEDAEYNEKNVEGPLNTRQIRLPVQAHHEQRRQHKGNDTVA